ALAAARVGDALAQSAMSDLLRPTLTDSNNAQRFGQASDATSNAQRFGRAPDGATRSTQPVEMPPASAGAGETGFDSTGSIAKQRRARRKPGSPFPVPRAVTTTPY